MGNGEGAFRAKLLPPETDITSRFRFRSRKQETPLSFGRDADLQSESLGTNRLAVCIGGSITHGSRDGPTSTTFDRGSL